MRTPTSLLLVSLALLAACETNPVDPSQGRFITNDRRTVVSPEGLAKIAKAWKTDPMATFGTSRASKRDAAWTIDFIATTESSGITPCTELTPIEIKKFELKPFSVKVGTDNARKDYSPKVYNEAWIINACGKQRIWRVLDDPDYRGDPHTVLLWSAG